jgi:acetylornithine deacetylase
MRRGLVYDVRAVTRLPDMATMLAELVALPSVSSPDPRFDRGNRPVVERVAEWAEALGFEATLYEVPGQHGKVNMVATRGSGRGGFVFSGHTDTVPCDPDLWESDPYVLTTKGSRLVGLGSADMKAFFAAVLHALAAIDVSRQSAPIHLVATADEESGMSGMRALADARALDAHHCVIGEPTELRPVRAHKGVVTERLTALGRAGHASDPSLGKNAIDGMVRALEAIYAFRAELAERHRDATFSVPTPTLNVGAISGGDSPNRICGRCRADLDLRLLPGMELEEVRRELEERVVGALEAEGLTGKLERLAPFVPSFAVDEGAELVRAAEEVTQKKSESVLFATEAPFYSLLGIETIVLGLGSIEVAHQPNEFIERAHLDDAALVYTALLKRLGYVS